MPSVATSISATTTPTITSAPPSRRPASTVGMLAGSTTRTMRCSGVAPMLRAASSRFGSMVRIPAAVASMVGKNPYSPANAILDAGPMPSHTVSTG